MERRRGLMLWHLASEPITRGQEGASRSSLDSRRNYERVWIPRGRSLGTILEAAQHSLLFGPRWFMFLPNANFSLPRSLTVLSHYRISSDFRILPPKVPGVGKASGCGSFIIAPRTLLVCILMPLLYIHLEINDVGTLIHMEFCVGRST